MELSRCAVHGPLLQGRRSSKLLAARAAAAWPCMAAAAAAKAVWQLGCRSRHC